MRRLQKKLVNTGAAVTLLFGVLLTTVHRVPAQTTPVAASELVLTLDPAQSQLHWNVDSSLHMVHGTFALKSGTVRLNPETGKADGEIVVSAPSGESGNGGRDKRMHKEILETAKYPEVIFRPMHIEGRVSRSGISDIKLSGIFSIHGTDHELTSQVHAELVGDHWTSTSNFEVPYVQWGIKDPSNFLLKVKPVVHVELEMSGEIKSPT
jgi:polyisoprenoid-binding protein YceI